MQQANLMADDDFIYSRFRCPKCEREEIVHERLGRMDCPFCDTDMFLFEQGFGSKRERDESAILASLERSLREIT